MPRVLAFAVLLAVSCPQRTEADDEYYDLMKVFVDTFEQIDRNYVKDVDRRELVEAAVRGMLRELDPYSNYIAPDQLADFTEDIEQEFGGIGVQVSPYRPEKKGLEIMAPLPGSPAFAVGLMTGDVIVEVNGEVLAEFANGQQQQEAMKRLKGPAGEQVEVAVVPAPGTAEERELGDDGLARFQITRDTIQLPTVFGESRDGGADWNYFLPSEEGQPRLAYVRLSNFTRRTTEELREAVKTITDDGAEGLVIDLRDNPGGLLTAAVEIVDMFLTSGKIVSTEGRNSRPRAWQAKSFNTYEEIPIAILVNGYSASASEITAAALQDHQRAVVIGTRTWGKGSVQNVIDLEGGESALKLTTASYFRPSGKNIHRFPGAKLEDEWGVSPDPGFEIKIEPDKMAEVRRRRMQVYSIGGPEPAAVEDPQLEKAVDHLRGVIAAKPANRSAA